MNAKERARATASTQEHLEIKSIADDLVITKSGSVALVIQTNAINFHLLAEHEQDAKIYAFTGLLNSLNFHIQILIRTQRIDISSYLNYLKQQRKPTMSEGLQRMLDIYIKFVQNLIVENDVLDKNFFIIVPYNPAVSLPSSGILKKKKSEKAQEEQMSMKEEQLLEKAKIFLYPKRDHILKQLNQMGLSGHQLSNQDLITEFYATYNPEEVSKYAV